LNAHEATAQAQKAYGAAVNGSCPDRRAVAELFRTATQAETGKGVAKPTTAKDELADYNVANHLRCGRHDTP
jgi:hypothetical protein